MPRRGSRPSEAGETSSRVTRSMAGAGQDASEASSAADVTYYTTMQSAKDNIQVISKRRLKNTEAAEQKLAEKFSRLESERLRKEAEYERLYKEERENFGPGASQTPSGTCPVSESEKKRIFFVTHLNIFLYATCFFIQVNTLPYLSKSLGADPVTFGQLQTAFAIAQLMGGPLYGRVGDLWGERLALMLAFASAATSYGLMGVATNLHVLFLSRLPSALMHVMQGSQMVVTYLSGESERATSLSQLGFSYGLGVVVGPTLGGFVTKLYGEQASALVACAGSLLSLALVAWFIPHVPKQKSAENNSSSSSVLDLKAILKLVFVPGVGIILLIRTVCGIPIGVLQSLFSMIAMERFELPPEKNGMMMSYIGLISILMQGAGIGVVTKYFTEAGAMYGSTIILAATYYCLTIISDIYSFLVLQFPLTCGLCLINSLLTAAITKTVDKSQTGAILGINMAVNSTIRSVAPMAGGYLMEMYGFEAIGYLGVVCNIAVIFLLKKSQFTT